jgi:hypothetical protein
LLIWLRHPEETPTEETPMPKPRGRPKGSISPKMKAIKEDFIDFMHRVKPNYSMTIMAKMFRVSPATISKWINEAGFKRWF